MEVSNSHGKIRRSIDTDVTSSGTSKRRRFDSQDHDDVFQLQYQSRRDVDVNFHNNVVLTAVSGVSDHVSSFICSINDDSIPDLKAECLSETEIINSSNVSFSGETSASSVVSVESEDMASVSSKRKSSKNDATSRRKPPPPPAAATTPSPAELEEFFSEAEKYEQKRFLEKYNYDIVKDVPIEGRYQWVRLKP